MKIYISGPMTGLPDFNRSRFDEVARELRFRGYVVLNPAENPLPRCGTWQGWMRMALRQLCKADCVVMLEGWQSSRGALMEKRLADDLGIPVQAYEGVLGANVLESDRPKGSGKFALPSPSRGVIGKTK